MSVCSNSKVTVSFRIKPYFQYLCVCVLVGLPLNNIQIKRQIFTKLGNNIMLLDVTPHANIMLLDVTSRANIMLLDMTPRANIMLLAVTPHANIML